MLACFDKTCAMQVLASPIFNAFTQTARNHRVGRRSLWSQDFVNKLTTTASSLRSMDTRSPISLLPQPASTWFCAFLQTQMTVDRATLLLLPSCQSLFLWECYICFGSVLIGNATGSQIWLGMQLLNSSQQAELPLCALPAVAPEM